jgi:hypothetical protein
VGQRGAYVRFLDAVMKKLLGIGVRIIAIERPRTKHEKKKSQE